MKASAEAAVNAVPIEPANCVAVSAASSASVETSPTP